MAKQARFNFRKFQTRWEREKETLPTIVARTAENQFKENFRLGGFLDGMLEKWQDRKKADAGRAILVKSGRLKRSVRAVPGYNFQEIKLASDVPYAKYHNNGEGHLPKRQFIGKSAALTIKIKGFIKKALGRVFS